ncbi:uncharacterized protein [Palaemon carinicauda]|uniref:uncharacterized protein n=1 Tax=Palaemon carinicauda TaxID=392227 RepID=UPI0035B67D6C
MAGPPPLPPFIQGATAVAASASVSGGGFPPPSPHLTPPFHHIIPRPSAFPPLQNSEALLHYTFPSEADTLAYVDALKHSDLSDWRSLQEVAARAGGGSCSGAVTTSVLTALYLLGLFNLCAASPASCCVPPASGRRRRRRNVDATLPPLLNNLQHNLSSLSLEQFRDLPHVTTPDGGRIPLHISVVDQVRKLWDSNPRLLSSVSCSSPTESVRSSFISLSGVASGIILAYSVAQLTQCYPDHAPDQHIPHKIWFFPIPNTTPPKFPLLTVPSEIPVKGDDERDDGCERNEVPLGFDRCAPLLSAEFCPYKHWVLLNKETGMGECVPRLCSENFVYVEADEMCHDINEPGICPGNRRLYLTASGNAICDCPEGMFPGPRDTCYFLHEPAYCNKSSVLQFEKSTKSLVCKSDPCGHINKNLWPDDLPYAPHEDGYCYQFNELGPCKKGQRFGFDSDKLEAACVSMLEAGLIRPRRSYMYQQMSYLATQDHQYPHYQVSYIIMNGTTWDLEVKGIGRERRDVHSSFKSHYLHPGEMTVPFIDTREIARDFHPFMKPRIPRWVINRRKRRGSSHSKGQKGEPRSRENSTAHLSGDERADEATVTEMPLSSMIKRGLNPALASISGESGFSISVDESVESSPKQVSQKKSTKNPKKSKLNRSRKRNRKIESSSAGSEDGTLIEVIQNHGEDPSTTSIGKAEAPKSRKVVKVDQTETSLPIVVHQVTQAPREEKARGKKKNRGSSKVRKKKKKHRRNRGRNRDRGRRRGRKKPHKSKNGTKTERDHKRKNPKLPFRVPTIQPPVVGNTTLVTDSDTISNVTAVDEIGGMTVDSRKHVTKGVSERPLGVSDHSAKSDSDGAVRTKPHRVSKTDSDNGVYEEEEEEEKENQTSSSETSLPKYLRHRGRRQLGEGGGIIQAPLLSACKPGAKRDYNYKCRPKFIPQERDRRSGTSVGAVSNTTPRPPRISCPEGTRLDPRGKCQQVS